MNGSFTSIEEIQLPGYPLYDRSQQFGSNLRVCKESASGYGRSTPPFLIDPEILVEIEADAVISGSDS